MQSLGTASLAIGMAVACLAQIVGAALIFRASVVQCALSLTIPGYFFFALKRHGLYKPVIGVWLVGIFGVVAGTIILS